LRTIFCATAMALLAFASAAFGQSSPHVHGAGVLNIAVEGRTVFIELMAPGSDIVRFEHYPKSDDDRKAVSVAVGKLKKGMRLFNFPKGAGCQQEEVNVESGLMESDGNAKTKLSAAHAEFLARYQFRCAAPEALNYINIGYFSMFSRAVELEVRTITSQGQGAVELTPTSSRLTF
jgi:hypothetical protein